MFLSKILFKKINIKEEIMKINRVISLFLSAIMFFSFGVNVMVMAGGENKIEILSNGNKLIYISTENLPNVISLFQEEVDRQENRKFSTIGNIIFKTIVASAGAAVCYAASKIDNTGGAVATGICAAILDVTAFFMPEYISSSSDYNLKESEPFVCEVGEHNPQPNDYGFGLIRLLMALKQICSHYWNYNFADEYPSYPNVYDGECGVIMRVRHGRLFGDNFDKKVVGFCSQSKERYKMLELSEVDRVTGRYLRLHEFHLDSRLCVVSTLPLKIDRSLIDHIYG
jgi:hypothetical protein